MKKLKNLLIYIFYKTSKLFRKKVEPKEVSRILVVSTTGLGDTIWGTPAIASIKACFPNAYLGVLTSALGKSVLMSNPYIDEFFTISHRPFFEVFKLRKALKKARFDTALIFHLSQRATLPLVYFSNIPRIIGTSGINKGLDFLLTKALKPKYEHEIARRLRIAEAAGAEASCEHLQLYLEKNDEKTAQTLAQTLRKKGPLIGLHPSAKDRFKVWPKEQVITLIKKMQKELGATVVLTGDKSEAKAADLIAQESGCTSVAGTLSLKEAAAFLKELDLFITNDTGPMHMAFSMNTKVLAFFGPTDPSLCGPYKAKNATILKKPRSCNPCLGKKCREPFCMMQISSDLAFENVTKILKVG